ncbi:MAG: SDR family NAD(P)-dependent oxidoreductase [Limimaricola sp.]|uniref:SDR family NAD(P)-dependent oxidoreductase n=1 Tax=Limimaricola sp. TaxID=2211665 RepID=UPI001D68D0B3|nr:SDR family NAD(P)-dependent oxidoreductase [Limimaricola sp.]MBI1415786.1 SDR family NAD(P)-dependent oxidoreductase [Limimaricola sp.]
MKDALIIGASGGIGAALAAALAADGWAVTGLSRKADGLDVTDPAAVERVLGALEGPFDAVWIALGILAPPGGAPEKALAAIEAEAMAHVMAVNAIGPALILRHVPRLLRRDAPGLVAVLSARVGSIGDNRIGGWHSYRASKAALNQIVRGAAVELGRTHRQAVCVALHPGTVATPFTAAYAGRHPTVAPEVAAENLIRVTSGLAPAQSGRFFDYSGAEVPW